jgi:hypothetical protein
MGSLYQSFACSPSCIVGKNQAAPAIWRPLAVASSKGYSRIFVGLRGKAPGARFASGLTAAEG